MMRSVCFALLFVASSSAFADEPPKPVAPADPAAAERIAVQAWGASHPECPQWTDGCVVCTAEGCSTPGVACTPTETFCRRK